MTFCNEEAKRSGIFWEEVQYSSTDEGFAMSGDDKNTNKSKHLTFNKLAFSFAVIVLLSYTVCVDIYVSELRSETKGLRETTRNGRAPPPSPFPAVL